MGNEYLLTCQNCKGSGIVYGNPCKRCRGKGKKQFTAFPVDEAREIAKNRNYSRFIAIYVNEMDGEIVRGFTSYGRDPETCKKTEKIAEELMNGLDYLLNKEQGYSK